MRVLVTGGSGFLGRQIVAALHALGAEVVAPGREQADLLHAAHRRTVATGSGAAILIHAAWITRPGAYRDSPDNLDWVRATDDLARCFAANGGRRFVLVGSCAEYDWSLPSVAPWTEDRRCRPATPYGAAKLLAWTLLRQQNYSVANARVFWPIGPHEHPDRLLPSLLRAARTGQPVATGPAGLTRDLLDVRDAGRAIAALALSRATGAVNIGSGIPIRLDALAGAVVGPGSRLIRPGARQLPPGEPLYLVADTTRLRAATGFAPRFGLRQIVADSLAAPAQAA